MGIVGYMSWPLLISLSTLTITCEELPHLKNVHFGSSLCIFTYLEYYNKLLISSLQHVFHTLCRKHFLKNSPVCCLDCHRRMLVYRLIFFLYSPLVLQQKIIIESTYFIWQRVDPVSWFSVLWKLFIVLCSHGCFKGSIEKWSRLC